MTIDVETTPTPDDDLTTGDVHAERNAARLRRTRRIAGVGTFGLGTLCALVIGFAGADGRAGMAFFLLVAAASCALAAVYGMLTAVVDDLRGVRVARSRLFWTLGLFLLGAMLPAMVVGLGG